MKQFSEKEEDVLLGILEKYEEKLIGSKGIHYVDVGYKYIKGEQTDKLAIRVHVHEKKPESALKPSEVISREIEGVPTDVIQSNPVEEQDRQRRFDPLAGGIVVWNTRLRAYGGTLGAIVYDADTLEPMGLTNHHVLVRNIGQRGDNIAQPATVDAADVIGTLVRWDRRLDCAICTLNNARGISGRIEGYPDRPGGPGGPTGVRRPSVGMPVTKSGIATGVTYGIVDGIGFTQFTVVPDPAHPSLNGEISASGDSGSVWLEVGSFNAVGLHWGGEQDTAPQAERAWAKRMDKVARKLDIVLTRGIA